MNEPNANPSPNEHAAEPPGNPASQGNPAQSSSGPLNQLRNAFEQGARKARDTAEQAAPKVKAAAQDAAYWFSFGVAYATVFSYVLVRELASDVVKTGWQDGAQAGQKKASEWASGWQQREAAPTEPGVGAAATAPGPEAQPA